MLLALVRALLAVVVVVVVVVVFRRGGEGEVVPRNPHF